MNEIFNQIKKINFHYSGVECDYTRVAADDCAERCANDYCRCSTLEDFVLEKVDCKEVAQTIIDNLSIEINSNLREKLEKIIETGFTINNLEFRTSGGYYGEEFDGVYIDDYSLITEIQNIFDIKTVRKNKLKEIEKRCKN